MVSRRDALKTFGLLAGAPLLQGFAAAAPQQAQFSFCLNVSTIRGQQAGFLRELEIAAQAGYSGVEIWTAPLSEWIRQGGSPRELSNRISDLGLKVENAIGFAEWIVEDDQQRQAGIELLKREMAMLAQIGCTRIAAPPAGASQTPGLNLMKAAERYHTILELGQTFGVVPQLEFWGASANLSNLGEALLVAAQANHPAARILPDIYHLYRGGSGYDGLKLVSGSAIEVFHFNDFPGNIDRQQLTDSDRIFPGDGVAPIREVIRTLAQKGSPVVFSLELFNRGYWQRDAAEVARTGLEKMKKLVSQALEN